MSTQVPHGPSGRMRSGRAAVRPRTPCACRGSPGWSIRARSARRHPSSDRPRRRMASRSLVWCVEVQAAIDEVGRRRAASSPSMTTRCRSLTLSLKARTPAEWPTSRHHRVASGAMSRSGRRSHSRSAADPCDHRAVLIDSEQRRSRGMRPLGRRAMGRGHCGEETRRPKAHGGPAQCSALPSRHGQGRSVGLYELPKPERSGGPAMDGSS